MQSLWSVALCCTLRATGRKKGPWATYDEEAQVRSGGEPSTSYWDTTFAHTRELRDSADEARLSCASYIMRFSCMIFVRVYNTIM